MANKNKTIPMKFKTQIECGGFVEREFPVSAQYVDMPCSCGGSARITFKIGVWGGLYASDVLHTPPIKPFTPRSGMVFKENVARNPRTAVLVEIEQAGRRWIAESVTNRAKFRIPAAKLHGGAYHDGWSKCESADALSESQIEVLASAFPFVRDK